MTSVFDENRRSIACTLIYAEPNVVTQVKTTATDGYEAIQLGFDEAKEKNTTQPLAGHFKQAGVAPRRKLVEFEFADSEQEFNLGDTVGVDIFEEGEFVDIVGVSKGKGFQGVVKRHGFSGVGERSHGQHNRERAPGSLGPGSTPSRVFKGMRMAGRQGNSRTKVKNLVVVRVLPDHNLILVRGAVPGPKEGFVQIHKKSSVFPTAEEPAEGE